MTTPVTCQVPMQDGVRLATDLYLPHGDGPHPIMILRTPYGRWQMQRLAGAFTTRGYGFLAQDVRGTGQSEGDFGLYAQEPADALDLARWLLGQSWCDGRLGILGLSYCAGASIAIPAAMPEAVKACIWVTAPVTPELLAWQGGALRLHHTAPWTLLLAEAPPLKARDWEEFYRKLPLASVVEQSPVWRLLSQQGEFGSPFWRSMDLGDYLDQVRAPGLHAGGWYDFVLDATLEPFRRISAASEAPQRLLLGAWSHNQILQATEFQGAAFAWLDRWFGQGEQTGAPAEVYITGDGPGSGWRQLGGWPEPTVVHRVLYLAPGGFLTVDQPDGGQDAFLSDPDDPVPTQGGAVWEFPQARMGLEPGPAGQTSGERPDVVTYETERLVAPLTICGEVNLELHASASTADADFTAKLCDVAPDGKARYICDGIIRARFRRGMSNPQLLTPGEILPLEIHMPCGHSLAAGHRLRLEVAGSNFPKFDRNLHTGGSLMHTGPEDLAVSRQSIQLGPSRLFLPVIPA